MEEPTTLIWLPNHDHRTRNNVAYTNGDRYVGELLGEERDGRGIYDYPSAQCRYDGEWKKGVRHGHATYYNSKNEKFEGDFRDGKRTKGSKTYHDRTRVLEGLWDNDELIGHGKVSWPGSHGGEYDGQLSAGNMFGSGKMTFRDGSVYQGEWSDNMPHGRGRMAYSSTEHYEGEWERGLPHGEGTLDYGGGIVLTGKWVKGMCVMGELKMASGAVYSGEFGAQCVFHGLGKIKFADGSSYSGNWAEGERHGAGEMTYADGSVYQGSWRAGARHGKGKVTYAGKRRVVVFCMWKDDDMGEKLTLAGEQWHSVDGWVAKAKKDGHGSQWALLDGEELEDGRAGLGGARGWRDHIVRWRKGATRR